MEPSVSPQDFAQVIGTAGRDVLFGSDLDSQIFGLQGRDFLVGGSGIDRFVYTALIDGPDVIQDFEIGNDQIDLHQLLAGIDYLGNTPFADGVIQVSNSGGSAVVSIDADGFSGGSRARAFILMQGIQAEELLSDPRHFILNPELPDLNLAAGLTEDTGVSATDGITANPSVSGTIDQPAAVEQLLANFSGGQAVDITDILQADGTFALSAAALAELNGGTLSDASYSLEFQAFAANNQSTATFTLAFDLDTTAPAIDLTLAPDFDSAPVGDRQTTAASVTFIGQTESNAVVTLEGLNQTTTSDSAGQFTFTNVDLALGENVFTVSARDIAGNTSISDATFTRLPKDIEAPVIDAALVNDTGISDTDSITADPTVTGTVSDNKEVAAIRAGFNNTAIADFVDVTYTLQDGTFLLDLPTLALINGGALPDGEYTLKLQAIDASGNTSAIYDLPFILDRSIPALSLELAPEFDTGAKADGETGLSAVTLVGQTEAGVLVELQGTDHSTVSDNTGRFSFSGVELAPGENSFTAIATDAAGNQVSTDASVRKTALPPLPNTAPVITSTPETSFTTDAGDYQYQIVATDDDGDSLTYTLVKGAEGVRLDSQTGQLIWDAASISPGTHEFTVQVSDGKGGVATQQFAVEAKLPPGIIRGTVWEDLNGNGIRDTNLIRGENPDIVFVVDTSGSSRDPFEGTPVGDVNNDGQANTILDAELAGFKVLNQSIIDAGFGETANVSVVTFGFSNQTVLQRDMNPELFGLQLTTNPNADLDGDGVLDIEQVLDSIQVFGGTNYELALQKVENTFDLLGTEPGNGNLIFLSDGANANGNFFADEVARLRTKGINLSAFGVGNSASLQDLQVIDPEATIFSSTDELINAFQGPNDASLLEPGYEGVQVYLDENENGLFDAGELSQITDEEGNYEFTGLEPGNYIVRETIPTNDRQTFPARDATNGDGFADVVLDYFAAGNAPSPQLVEPYGSNGGIPSGQERLSPSYTVEAVSPDGVLGAPPASPIIGSNSSVEWLALPQGSYVTVGFTDETVIDGPGADIFIRSFDPEDSAGERANVYVSSDGIDFTFLGTVKQDGLQSLDLADIGFTKPVTAVRIEGVDNLGSSPGFDLISVEALPGSIGSPDFHEVNLEPGELIEDLDFGNQKIPTGSIQGTVWEDINGDGIQNISISETHNLIVAGTDAIFLADRSEIAIPALGESDASFPLRRHSYIRGDFLQETQPKSLEVNAGDILKFEANGQIDFYNDTTGSISPDGNNLSSNLQGVGQISAYTGPRGALLGVFVDNTEDRNTNNEAIDFSEAGTGTNFIDLSPDLGQIFFIGDGLSNGEIQQEFTTPEGATHLYLGLADGWNFTGTPGYYEDNDGAYEVTIYQESRPENGQSNVSVYLDIDRDGIFDADEPSQITDTDGNYEFTGLNPGNYLVGQQAPDGFEQVFPTALSTELIFDESFDANDWSSSFLLLQEGTGVPVVEQAQQEGGYLEEYRSMTHTWGGGTSAIVYHKYEGFTYDPSIQGGIDNIDYLEDQVVLSARDTVGRGLVIFQGEDIFRTEISGFNNRNWESWSLDDLQAEDFVSDITGNNPDFSGSGSAMQFGYLRSNIIHSRLDTVEHGIDNWLVSLQSEGASSQIVSLSSDEVVSDINFGNQRTKGDSNQGGGETTNQAPVFTSNPPTIAQIDQPFQYQAIASDAENDALTYSLLSAPEGMTIDDSGFLSWQPATSDIGSANITILVTDSAGNAVQQAFELSVQEPFIDTEAPTVEIGFSGNLFSPGDTLDLQVRGTDNVGLTELSLTFNDTDLPLSPETVVNGQINTAQVELTEPGLYTVTATAEDAAGNIGTETAEIRVIDPTDQTDPVIELDLSGINEGEAITESYDIVGTISDPNLAYYWVEYAPVGLVDLNNIGENDPDYVLLAEGTTPSTDVLATIDPRFIGNDNYAFRVIAQDVSGNASVKGFVRGIATSNKVGNFTLDATDLNIPLTGIPITINRRYDTLQADTEGSLGLGWEFAGLDANISESVPVTDAGTIPSLFSAQPFKQGTRVYLTNPEGERIGFTFEPEFIGFSFLTFFGAKYRPRFVPDPGVEEELTVDYAEIAQKGDGSYGIFPFGFAYNPSVYHLTTKDGLTYTYDQFDGLQTVEDRNNNVLTYTDEGIFSSTGESVRFNRDEQGRIASIIDPTGNGVTYSYDADGNLVGVTDRAGNTTQYVYDPDRPHYLVEEINPLGFSSIRTEYDDQGRLSRIIDADGNALDFDIDFEGATDTQTLRDPLGNATTLVYDESGNVIQQVDAEGGITGYTYDADNNITSITDPRGNTTSYTYDDRGNQLTETDALGFTTTTTYNEFNQVTSVTDAIGSVITNRYDDRGNLLEREDAAGNITQYAYLADGNLREVVDAAGNVTNYGYDSRGRATVLEDATGATTQFTYDNAGNLTSITTPEGNTTRFGYDAEGQLIQVTDAQGNVTQVQYNAAGDRTAVIDALGRRTEYSYNSRGLQTETRYADGTTEQFLYDANDQRIASIDRAGRITRFVYDGLGRLVTTLYPDATPDNDTDNPRTSQEYDQAGNLIAFIDENGNRTEYGYNAADQRIVIRDALGFETIFDYDPVGNMISLTDALNRQTQYTYDKRRQRTEVTFADGTTARTVYDALGRVATEIDQNGIAKAFEYDEIDQLTLVRDALGNETRYVYDGDGNLITQIDALGQTTTYQYDVVNQRIATLLPLGQTETYTYDAVGNLTVITDFNGQTISYDYDSNDLLREERFEDGSTVEYAYTPNLLLETVTDDRGSMTYGYDERNRLITQNNPDGTFLTYGYDAAGNRTSLTTPSGDVQYSYDTLNRLATVTDRNDGTTAYTYDPVGNLIQTLLSNGVIETRDYNDVGNLVQLEQRLGAEILARYDYRLDDTGRRTQVEELDGRTATYTYDALYRLLEEQISDSNAGDRTISYTYDNVGNRLTRIDSADGSTSYVYDANNRLLSYTLNGETVSFIYDENGNTRTRTNSAGTTTYTWDQQNRLIQVELPNGDVIEYQYDTDGNRVAEIINGVENRFLVDEQEAYAQVVEEYQPDGTVEAAYTFGNDLISQEQNGEQTVQHGDGQGSVQVVTDEAGNVTDTITYDAFGLVLDQTGDTEVSHQYTGEQFDYETGLTYLRARYYDAETGRFLSQDPFEGFFAKPLTQNGYSYVENDPANATDPSGLITAISYGGISAEFTTGKAGSFIGSLVGGIHGFGTASVIFVANILEIANRGDDIIEKWAVAKQATQDELEELQTNLARVSKVDKKSGLARGFLDGAGYEFELELENLDVELECEGNVGGFIKGNEIGLAYIDSVGPSGKSLSPTDFVSPPECEYD